MNPTNEERVALQLFHSEHIRRWANELDEAIRSGNSATRKSYISGIRTELEFIESLEKNDKSGVRA